MYKVNWKLPSYIEHRVADIMHRRRLNGWDFDTPKAKSHVEWLESEQQRTEQIIRPYIGNEVIHTNRISRPFRKDGTLSEQAKKHYDDVGDISGPFNKIRFEPVNLGSRQKIAQRMLAHGWEPTEYTEKGSPKLTIDGKPCPNLEQMDDELGPAVAHWYNCNHRLGVIRGWIENVQEDDRIYYSVNPCGTNTRRMRHQLVVNVPKAEDKVFFGQEMRELFIARDPYKLVGIDAAGMENRVIAHYMLLVAGDRAKNEIEPILDPEIDFHTRFWEAISDFIESRSHAKNVEYAYFFGAQDYKLGTMANFVPRRLKSANPERVGQEIRAAIGNRFPSLNQVLEYVAWHVKKYGYLVAPDGSKLFPRGDHSAFNTWVQGTGQVFFKTALCFADRWFNEEELDYALVGVFHDEMQSRVHPNSIDRYRELSELAMVKAGEFLDLKVPMEGESVVGTNWAETH